MDNLCQLISGRQATVAVIGQGYVGLPLAMTISKAGFNTYGIDVDPERVDRLRKADSYIVDVTSAEIEEALSTGRYHPTTDFHVIAQSQVVVVCVPTPLRKTKDPDMTAILRAVQALKPHLHADMLIILESTTYPGTTDELIASAVAECGHRPGEDVYVCFSPERVDPGNQQYNTQNTPKVVGGINPASTHVGALFYGQVMDSVVPVSSARVAEMVKLLENTFRAVNIGLVNEMALMCERMGVDVWEVVGAAATKPFGFMPFYPGPGVGGHCIPLDPEYLSWKAKTMNFYSRFIEMASDINGNMPRHVASKVSQALNLVGKAVSQARILVLGVTYKRDVDDIRESPSLEVLELLLERGATIEYHDPYVPCLQTDRVTLCSVPLTDESLSRYDCVLLATDHTAFDYQWIANRAVLIVDTRNAFRGVHTNRVISLGAPTPTLAEWEQRNPSAYALAVDKLS